MLENNSPGAPAPTAPSPTPAVAAAESEIAEIMSGRHKKSAAWKNSDRATLST